MSKKMLRLLLVGLTVVLLLVLAACQGAAPTPTQAPAEAAQPQAAAPTEAAQPQAAATEAPAASSGEQRVFRLWYYEAEDSAQEASWSDALKDFEAKHPDVKVEFERKTFEQMQQTAQMVLNS